MFSFTSSGNWSLVCLALPVLICLVLPVLITGVWSGGMYLRCEKECWDDYSSHSIIYILIVPMITALSVNLLFLINIVRIIITKLRNQPTLTTQQLQVVRIQITVNGETWMKGGLGYRVTKIQENLDTGRLGYRETWILGNMNTGKPGYREPWTEGNLDTGNPGQRETRTQGNLETGKPEYRETWIRGNLTDRKPGYMELD